MSEDEQPTSIRKFRKDAYDELIIREETEVETHFGIRHFEKNAYNELRIIGEVIKTPDDYLKVFGQKAKIILDLSRNITGIFILAMIVCGCLWVVLRGNYDQSTTDSAIKFLILIVGAILGTLFPNQNSGSK